MVVENEYMVYNTLCILREGAGAYSVICRYVIALIIILWRIYYKQKEAMSMTEIFETINFTMTLLLPSEYRMRIMYESQPALFSYTQNKTNEERWWLWEEHEIQKQTKLKSFFTRE